MMIADNIKKHRENSNLTQSQLAHTLGISRSSVNAWEQGLTVPQTRFVIDMSKLFSVSTDSLILGKDSEMISISHLNQNQKKLLYSLLDYFKSENLLED